MLVHRPGALLTGCSLLDGAPGTLQHEGREALALTGSTLTSGNRVATGIPGWTASRASPGCGSLSSFLLQPLGHLPPWVDCQF